MPSEARSLPRLNFGPGGTLTGLALFGIAASVAFGTIVPVLWRIGLVAAGATMAAAAVGPDILLQVILLTSGISLAPITGNQRALLESIGGLNLDGLRLLAVLAGFAWAAARDPALVGPRKLVWPYAAFLMLGTASLAWAPSKIEALRLLLKLAFPLTGFFLAARAAAHGRARIMERRLAVGAIIAVVANVILSVILGQWGDSEAGLRFHAGLGPNVIGHFSAITALACYAWWTRERRPLLLVAALLMVAQMVATGSRTAYVSLGLGLLVFNVFSRKWRIAAALTGLAVAAWVLLPTLGARTGEFDRASSAIVGGSGLGEINFSGRIMIWADVIHGMVLPGGALGNGLGSAAGYLASRYETIRHVHNEFIRVLAELGPPGLGLFLLAYLWPLGWSVIGATRRKSAGSLAYALAASAICTFLTASIAENTFELFATYSIFPWVLVGLTTSQDSHESG